MSDARQTAATIDPLALGGVDRFPDAEQQLVLHRDVAAHDGLPPQIHLGVAENVMLYPLLKLHVFAKLAELPVQSLKYVTAYGSPELREKMAARLEKSLIPDQHLSNAATGVHRDDVFATAGVSSALECIALALRQSGELRAGDTVLLPAPYWQGFKWSFEQRPELRCVPAHVGVADDPDPVKRFELSLANLQMAYDMAEPKPRLLVLTNPNNPLGVNYRAHLLEEIYTWALGEGMHIISDEIYRHSQLDGADPKFVSALALAATRREGNRERVHVVWGLGKDFGLSGFRTGFIISRSPEVRAAMEGSTEPDAASLSWFSPFDSLKHRVVLTLLDGEVDGAAFWDVAMREYHRRLGDSFTAVKRTLRDWDVDCVHPDNGNAAQFLWLDLTRWVDLVPEHHSSGMHLFPGAGHSEAALANYLAATANVTLLPGQTLSSRDRGYFRLCFTACEKNTAVKAANRIGEALHRLHA
ncbi:aminotransferase class I/II-fold pyridoxal phosphate-dependent enzyme [Saccharopolyspora sp. 5N708]|uniref:aminotransferase class I/II-fold pyridoxal phosphate-dependent enzyme n=1 Tax=Saccharopolyspora sp. 5N708 TaxID=3457424 RepID=UPI003FD30D4B